MKRHLRIKYKDETKWGIDKIKKEKGCSKSQKSKSWKKYRKRQREKKESEKTRFQKIKQQERKKAKRRGRQLRVRQGSKEESGEELGEILKLLPEVRFIPLFVHQNVKSVLKGPCCVKTNITPPTPREKWQQTELFWLKQQHSRC